MLLLTIYSCGRMQEYKGASSDILEKDKTSTQRSTDKAEPVDRKIIKEGEIRFETSDINETKSLIDKTAKELGGYISKDDANDYSDRHEHRLIIRVPSDKFDLLLQRISENAKKIDSKNINVLDVTAEYIDIDARIKTKKELRDRYKEILKKASKVDEILSIEKEIGQLETDIESVEGQMKYLKDRISYSTLTATYYEKTSVLFGFPSIFVESFRRGWDFFLWFIIGVTNLWTFIFAGIVIYLIVKYRKKRKKNGT